MQSAVPTGAVAGRVTLWVCPLPVELQPFLSLAEATAAEQVAGLPCWKGSYRGVRVRAALCGAGGQACAEALGSLLDQEPGSRVILVGLAGALNPRLGCGDVVVASRPVSWPPDRGGQGRAPLLGAAGLNSLPRGPLRRRSGAPLRVVSGSVLSWPEIVRDGQLRDHLWRAYGADCVDMETGHAARLCQARDVPFLAVRGISDRADETVSALNGSDLALAAWRATIVAAEAVARPRPGPAANTQEDPG